MEVTSDGSLRAATRPLVVPPPGHVRLRVQACGVCHSDSASFPAPPAGAGMVPGHEIVGLIEAVGEGVTTWAVGERAGVGFLGGHCGVCEPCRWGRFSDCTDQPRTGITVEGGYAEVVTARVSGLVRIPENLSALQAAPLLCAGFTTYNALLRAAPVPGSTVGVQGIGGLGHLGIQYADRMGHRVVALARGKAKEALARELGADEYIDTTAIDAGQGLRDLGGADLVLATGTSGASMTPLLGGLRHGGLLMALGASDEAMTVTPNQLIFDGVRLAGSLTGSSMENEANLRFAAAQGVQALVEQMPLDEAGAGYAHMMAGHARFRVVLTMS
ncbi:propanol-preferring alcohol dehydrogenase [Kineococcus radiotolerans]|uniref:Alcohol dehydrogenase n=1 Tax=Kineococcus radiotolerans TaxID=131568 RepID=A0A7W4TRK0_KINRA|nr:alcohol dehydrogenase catalytic domain-containing protein [Kineococcus radiotolerans]MBB2903221.1 propanol-preferring alcohol dehydrogenase [Kineococcus radiotolerans]